MSARPPLLFVGAFGAGLATGLARFGAPIGVAAIMGVLAWALRRRPLPALLLAAAALGALHAEVAWRRERSACTSRLPEGRVRLLVRLEEPADAGGGALLVRPLQAGCGGVLRARWPEGAPRPAGVSVQAAGRWIRRDAWSGRPDGVLAISHAEAGRGRPGAEARLRTTVARASRELYGGRAPLVDALIVGRRADLDPAIRDAFAQSGLVHLLSISGFHVGLLAGWVVLAARLLRVRRDQALVAAAVVAGLYVAFLGWPAPATRAAALAGLLALCR
ncbi:MAG TPA: ComEC/Rec2 family competence protein, partial [Gemmatimonadales bacterium]|nr:ComEC/Rec2 family competence protein [Gemmatimonadales bacterium]